MKEAANRVGGRGVNIVSPWSSKMVAGTVVYWRWCYKGISMLIIVSLPQGRVWQESYLCWGVCFCQ